jgi:hypothetical protein
MPVTHELFVMYDQASGGSGKRSLPMARGICLNTIGKLRRLPGKERGVNM